MPHKCGGPLCGKLVSEKQFSCVRLGDHLFCSQTCKREWLDEQHIEVVSNPNMPVVSRMNGG